MATLTAPTPNMRTTSRRLVEPAVFAERMLSHERLERFELAEDNLLGLRNTQTGETLYVDAGRFRSWLLATR